MNICQFMKIHVFNAKVMSRPDDHVLLTYMTCYMYENCLYVKLCLFCFSKYMYVLGHDLSFINSITII